MVNETVPIDWRSDLLSKQGKIVTLLARDLLSARHGDRLPSMQDYADHHHSSAGTVQAAFSYLSEIGVVSLDVQGKLGTFARELDYPALWRIAFQRPIIGAYPLPDARNLAALATGLRTEFAANRVDDAARFVRGSMTRLGMLQSGACDFALVSRFVAESASVYGFSIETALNLGADSYTVDQVLLLREGDTLKDGMRIGIDVNSTDHAYVVRQVSRGVKVTFVEIDYTAGLDLLASSAIDATVWTHEIPPSFGFTAVRLNTIADVNKLGEAALVVQSGNRAATNLLIDALNAEKIRAIQREVMRRERLPSY